MITNAEIKDIVETYVPDKEHRIQMQILLETFQLYQQRDALYGNAWSQLGALNNLTRISTKVQRLLNLFWHKEISRSKPASQEGLDDAYDAINYCVFFIRQALLGQWTKDR